MGKALHNKVNKVELKKALMEEPFERTTLSFYQYAHIGNVRLFRDHMYNLLDSIKVFGRIYVANEGINGQVSVPEHHVQKFRKKLNEIVFLQNVRLNFAIDDDGKSFIKLMIKMREKIVADGLDDLTFDVTNRGIHIDAEQFNQLTQNDETIVVDMRNHYESEVGHFEGAIIPDVATFREALPHVEDMLNDKKDTPIIMYCTGGIRCEKASAFYKHKGFQNVYQLDGGIIEYARQVEKLGLDNKFIGKNFVFDDRLGERISEDIISKCHQCGMPNDDHTNCANDPCHILFIQCKSCTEKFNSCCSDKCKDFMELPEEDRNRLRITEVFNGTKFGKGRYKAHHSGDQL